MDRRELPHTTAAFRLTQLLAVTGLGLTALAVPRWLAAGSFATNDDIVAFACPLLVKLDSVRLGFGCCGARFSFAPYSRGK